METEALMDITVNCRFQVGDVVRWASGKDRIEEIGPGPFVITAIDVSHEEVFLSLDVQSQRGQGWYDWRFELDPFLTAVRRRRHV